MCRGHECVCECIWLFVCVCVCLCVGGGCVCVYICECEYVYVCLCIYKEMATHSSVLAWRIPGTAEPGGLLSMGSHRAGHD